MSTLVSCQTQHGERFVGGLGIRDVILTRHSAQEQVQLHAHRFDHVMFFAEGEATVTAHCPCGATKTYHATAGDSLLIPATWTHGVVALSDRVKFWCVFPEYDEQGRRQGDVTAEVVPCP